jgi:hypothetical protein
MLMCAFRQGHGQAAYEIGMRAELLNAFDIAMEYYQAGTTFGSERCAVSLRIMFDKNGWTMLDQKGQEKAKQMGIVPDAEREKRYDDISDALRLNPDLRLTRLDRVLPLPPAKLPPWRGIVDAIEPEPDGSPTY